MGHKHYRKLRLASVFDSNIAAIATPSRHVGTFPRLAGLRKDIPGSTGSSIEQASGFVDFIDYQWKRNYGELAGYETIIGDLRKLELLIIPDILTCIGKIEEQHCNLQVGPQIDSNACNLNFCSLVGHVAS